MTQHPSTPLSETPLVVLIHGIWMSGWIMRVLARRLRKAGFRTALFSYHTVKASPAENSARLASWIDAHCTKPVILVAHSLGGVVSSNFIQAAPPGTVKCLVLIGSPLGGSLVARSLSKVSFGRWMLGKSIEHGLLEPAPRLNPSIPTGMIAGSMPIGVGVFVGGMRQPNDGAVAVSETRVPGLQDHIVLSCSHTSLLFSAEVARQVVAFIKTGHFARN